ncbi:hypothetical protein J0H58_14155 [bacterium]|nr:hypothetical protein [bacterium]
MALGHDLDHLERHIDWYGSVVARGPDVWGQARLTEHREQFEEEMEAELKNFHLGLQGSLARSDQAFFAHATALSSAAQPKPPAIGRVSSVKSPPVLVPTGQQVVADNGRTVATGDKDKAGLTLASKQTTTTTFEPAPNDPPVKAAANPDLTQELTDLKEAIHRTDVKLERVGFGAMKDAGIGIEPTLMLAQKKRFLDFLNQVRRENEGDDTADSPGYSLNLVRIPVSILPGKRTDVGHGAEITMTLTPVLGDDLLPTTFRNLVANDLRHQLGLPLAEFLNDKDAVKQFLKAENRPVLMGLPVFNELNVKVRSGDRPAVLAFLRGRTSEERGWLRAVAELLDAGLKDTLLALLAEADVDAPAPTPRAAPGQAPAAYSTQFHARVEDYAALVRARPGDLLHGSSGALEIRAFSVKLNIPSLAFSPGLVNKTGFPTSQLLEVYGLSNCFQIAFAANNAMADVITRQGYAHLPDVQGFLQQETIAAYRLLADPQCTPLWQAFCTPEMASAVRTRKLDQLEEYREHYRTIVI